MHEPAEPAVARNRYEESEAQGYGLTAADLRRWAPFHPLEIHWARKRRLPLETARRWERAGIAIQDTVCAVALGMSLDEVRPWTDAGFLPADAVDAREAGISLETAIAWREAGFILPDAALLINEGWTLEEAKVARFADIHRYGEGSE